MMNSSEGFLNKIAQNFIMEDPSSKERYAFVFPNRRSVIYFRKMLGEISDKTLFSPQIFSIGDFATYCSGINIPENFELVFELYAVYRKISGAGFLNFEDFFHEGKIILQDFSEIDKNLADPGKIFRELKNFREIDSRGKEKFSALWEKLEELYRNFRSSLESRNLGYEGMVFGKIAKDIQSFSEKGWEKIIFAGFNVLSEAEKKMISDLEKSGKGEILFEMDSYFLDNEDQESGKFIRKYLKDKTFGENTGKIENILLNGTGKNIRIIGAPSKVGQIKIIGSLLEEESMDDISPEDVAIILPDETLLLPMLNSIPKNIKKGNISLGFPLSQTSVYSLINSIIEMRANESEDFYSEDVLHIIEHPYIEIVFPDEFEKIKNRITKSKKFKIKDTEIEDSLLKRIFLRISGSDDLLLVLLELLERIRELYEKDDSILPGIEMEFVFHFYLLFLKLKKVIEMTGIYPDVRGFKKLFPELAASSHIPFTGEPLEGIQILGLLEAQNLKFKKLFIPSMNEGVFPKRDNRQTFIPSDVRKANGLPLENETDSVSAYNFYRLLKNSDDITLIYADESVKNSKGEKSRFLNQLILEYAEKCKDLRLTDKSVIFPIEGKKIEEIIIQKNENHFLKLKERSFSATSLKTYLVCPLQFYFRYITGLKVEDKDDETQEPAFYGKLVHSIVEEIYNSAIGRVVNRSYLNKFYASGIDNIIRNVFNINRITEIETGRNRITFEVLKKFITEFIEKEKKNVPFKILGIEKNILEKSFNFISSGNQYSVSLKGKIDRIDSRGDVKRIIDYKSGMIKKLSVSFNEEDDDIDWKNFPEIFQLLFYSLLLKRSGESLPGFMLGIYPFKNFYNTLEFVTVNDERIFDDSMIEKFEKILSSILKRIFDPKIPFSQTKDPDSCRFCPYINICGKGKTVRD